MKRLDMLDITHRHVHVALVSAAVFIGLILLLSLSAYPAIAISNGSDDAKFVEIFKDDFEDGNTVGWKFIDAGGGEVKDESSTWKVESEGSNHVLSGEEHTLAQIKTLELNDLSLETKFKFIKEPDDSGFHLTVHDTEKGRYFIGFGINFIRLSKTERRLYTQQHIDMYKTYAQFNTNTWYTAKILIIGNNIKIYVNDVLKIDYVDAENPLLSGWINFETLENSHIHFDNVRVLTPAPSQIIGSSEDVRASAQLWNSKGIAFSEAGRYQDALNAFDKAIELDPNNANAWEGKGIALQDLGRNQEAVDALVSRQ